MRATIVAGKYSPLNMEAKMAMVAKTSMLKMRVYNALRAPYPIVKRARVAEEN